MLSDRTLEYIRRIILENIPKEARITKVEFEGPRIIIYSKRPIFLVQENINILKEIAKTIKKRVEVRPDSRIRKKEEEAKEIILQLVPKEAEITGIYFNEETGEVEIEAKKPGFVIGKNGIILSQIFQETLWRPRVTRTPPISSRIVNQVRETYRSYIALRRRFLRETGEIIHREIFFKDNRIRIVTLGGFGEVGRSAILIQTNESNVLLDCGVKPSSKYDEYPFFDIKDFDIDELDAVIITHAHLDHCGFVPFLYKWGYRGPVYVTEPTLYLMKLLQEDYIDVNLKEGKMVPYTKKDISTEVIHIIPLRYGEVTDIAPDIKLTFHNAGHVLGSAMAHLHIGNGLYNIVYTGDFKFGRTRLLERADYRFPRAEVLIMESTYGGKDDIMMSRENTEKTFLSIVNETIKRNGIVLIPVLGIGRAQEIMVVLADAIKNKLIPEVPIFIEGMIGEATAIHTTYPEYLSRIIKEKIYYEESPFMSDFFEIVKSSERHLDIVETRPSIVMATSGMLIGGPVLSYLKLLANDPRNSLIFVSYQVEGTLGRKILQGLKEIPFVSPEGKTEIAKLNMQTYIVNGFSGHSDRNQLISYVNHLLFHLSQNSNSKLEYVIINHGERKKIKELGRALKEISRKQNYGFKVLEPLNTDAFRFR